MRHIKRFILLALSIVILCMSMQEIAFAKNADFVVENGVLIKYNGSGGKVVIPSDLGITAIGNNVFKNNDSLTSIVIPSGVKTIGASAFEGCGNLVSITMPTGLTTIGDSAFAGDANYDLNSIVVPEGVRSIGKHAFSGLHYLQSLTLPGTLEAIGDYAFAYSYGIPSIYVPASVTTIGAGAFMLGKFPPIKIHGVAESYAETYAKENGLTFLVTAAPATSSVKIDGAEVSIAAYNIDGHNYFKLRDLAMALNGSAKQFKVEYSFDDQGYGPTNKTIKITTKTPYTPVGGELTPLRNRKGSLTVPLASTVQQSTRLYIDGNEFSFDFYGIDGNNYFKLRDIAKAIDFNVAWDAAANTVLIDTTLRYND